MSVQIEVVISDGTDGDIVSFEVAPRLHEEVELGDGIYVVTQVRHRPSAVGSFQYAVAVTKRERLQIRTDPVAATTGPRQGTSS